MTKILINLTCIQVGQIIFYSFERGEQDLSKIVKTA
jgi:hypothetical protein